MEPSTQRVQSFVTRYRLDAELIATPSGVPTVETAAAALDVPVDRILKTLVFTGPEGEIVIAMACGTGKVDRLKLAAAAGVTTVKIASPERVLEATGFPAGGVAPVDLPAAASVVIDERVMNQVMVYGGSGTDQHMLRIYSADIARINDAKIAPILRDEAG